MDAYLLFLIITVATVMSPGPGVLLTLTNAIRFGVSGAIGGILGLAVGAFLIAGVSATGLGILLATSAVAFTVLKFIGAAYLIYLGVKLWRAPPAVIELRAAGRRTLPRQFAEGLGLQLTNPKAVFFFLSILPQFVTYDSAHVGQFALLVCTYSVVLVVVHLIYAALARTTRQWLASDSGGRLVNRLGGGTFMGFGLGLAATSR
ncbi:Threonine/homoserine/homoserine lactone efflux protein [Halopseudomonas sabulinigri]|uniref:Threonine/homoserine/homoserine lactone efflux protein n=1 Tax=Halopseudomonas sabulinigri TaxID=472181 RepID=A0A1H1N9X0_9GAMM|nr:LysE family translocator [Halopseudomonas sabulinigri]SDR95505.1 Threonine/homoserine/homoserine lactone efflux protein [Halopseudomonas sabulinigri]